MDTNSIRPIGIIHSSLKDLRECPLQEYEGGVEANLVIADEYVSAFENIEVGDELILITWLHLARRDVLKCYPRNEVTAPVIGVFSTRSPDRPNPVGLHHVKVTQRISPKEVRVYPLEALDGTPVIDIKPVIRNSPI